MLRMEGVDLAQLVRAELERGRTGHRARYRPWLRRPGKRCLRQWRTPPDGGTARQPRRQRNPVRRRVARSALASRRTADAVRRRRGPGISPSSANACRAVLSNARQRCRGCGLGLAIAREIAARHGALLRIVDLPAPRSASRGCLPDNTERKQRLPSRPARPVRRGRQDHRRREVATIRNVGGTSGE